MSDRDEISWVKKYEPNRLGELLKRLNIVELKTSNEEKLYNLEELYHLNKLEQIKIINSFGIKDIPPLEKERVELILNNQIKFKGGK